MPGELHTYLHAGIMGTLFDISHFKWAESVQRRRVEEALEAKRQQEKCFALSSLRLHVC
jgi:hypothetical protein